MNTPCRQTFYPIATKATPHGMYYKTFYLCNGVTRFE
jgi:hypothetical protein